MLTCRLRACATLMSDRNRPQPLLVIQARTESRRLPSKVLAEISGRPLLELLVERVRGARSVSGIVVATSTREADDRVAALADSVAVDVFRGSSEDVLGRFVGAAEAAGADSVIRVCGDSPLLDAATVDTVVEALLNSDADIARNHLQPGWPFGVSVEAMTGACLSRLDQQAHDVRDREHVTIHAYEHTFRVLDVPPPPELRSPDLRLCVDTEEDLENVGRIYESFAPRTDFALSELVERAHSAGVG